jgi:predicted NBD/HSP70 family sugar kinase
MASNTGTLLTPHPANLGVDHQDMARVNRTAVLRLVRHTGGLSRAELAQGTGLTPTALTSIAGDLLALGLLREEPAVMRGPGRPAARLVLNPDWGRVITLSVTHTLAIGVVDLSSRLLYSDLLAAEDPGPPPRFYGPMFEGLVTSAVKRLLRRESGNRVLGIGVLCNGRVDRYGIARENSNLPRHSMDLRELLRPVTDLPVHVDEEFRLLLRAQLWDRDTPPWQNAVAVSCRLFGTGGGQAAMVNGQICSGHSGFAGQPGNQMALLHNNDICRELSRQVEEMGGQAAYLRRVKDGDAGVAEIYRKCVENYGFRLAQIANHLNPEVILVYTPYHILGEAFLAEVRQVMTHFSGPYNLEGLHLQLADGRTDENRLVAAAIPVMSKAFVDGMFEVTVLK